MGLELLQTLDGVVDQSEASGLATSEMRAQTEHGNRPLVGFVEVSQLAAKVILRDICEIIPSVRDVRRS